MCTIPLGLAAIQIQCDKVLIGQLLNRLDAASHFKRFRRATLDEINHPVADGYG